MPPFDSSTNSRAQSPREWLRVHISTNPGPWKAQINRDIPECLELKINGVESTTVYRQLGQGSFECYTCDLTDDYVKINADYRN